MDIFSLVIDVLLAVVYIVGIVCITKEGKKKK